MSPLFEVKDIDRQVYEQELKQFLPQKMIDIHTHVWLDRLKKNVKRERVVTWPGLVAKENPIEDHLEGYRLMFPDKEVTPMIFTAMESVSKYPTYPEDKYIRPKTINMVMNHEPLAIHDDVLKATL